MVHTIVNSMWNDPDKKLDWPKNRPVSPTPVGLKCSMLATTLNWVVNKIVLRHKTLWLEILFLVSKWQCVKSFFREHHLVRTSLKSGNLLIVACTIVSVSSCLCFVKIDPFYNSIPLFIAQFQTIKSKS